MIYALHLIIKSPLSILIPMMPAVGILLARNSIPNSVCDSTGSWFKTYGPLVPAFALSLLIVRADVDMANKARSTARKLMKQYSLGSYKIWFMEHWGFQLLYAAIGCGTDRPSSICGG